MIDASIVRRALSAGTNCKSSCSPVIVVRLSADKPSVSDQERNWRLMEECVGGPA
jgi:hypothetical protein